MESALQVFQLCTAAKEKEKLSILKELIEEKKYDCNLSDYDGRTALHLAAEEGNVDAVKLLISHGANVMCQGNFVLFLFLLFKTTKDRWLQSPLSCALRNLHHDVAQVLRSSGAFLKARSAVLGQR